MNQFLAYREGSTLMHDSNMSVAARAQRARGGGRRRATSGCAVAVLLGLLTTGAASPPEDPPVTPADGVLDTAVDGVFAPDAPFYQPLPDDTPVAEDSDALIASLHQQSIDHFGRPGAPNVTINVDNYTAPLYVTGSDDPQHDIRPWNCQGKDAGWDAEFGEALRARHVPPGLQPDGSSDGNVSVYNPDTDELVELWQARWAPDGVLEACWGGVIEDASQSGGSFPTPYGASAGGMALWGYTIRHDELLEGRIDHVVGIGIPLIKRDVISWPAVRTDGRVDGAELAMGQMMRLPADFDLDSLNLSPAARTVAQAAQDYGIIVTDTSGAVAFYGEHVFGVPDDRYDEIFRGRSSFQEMAGDPGRGEDPFPLQELVALPVDYGQEAAHALDESGAAAALDGTAAVGAAAVPGETPEPAVVVAADSSGRPWPVWPAVVTGVLVAAAAVVVTSVLRSRRRRGPAG